MDLLKIAKLVDLLSQKTAEGNIDWKMHPGVGARYFARVGSHIVTIDQSRFDAGADPDYSLGFADEDLNEIDSVSDVDMKEVMSNSFQRMRGLYHAAQRSARGVTQIVNDLLKDLDDDKPF